MKNSEALWPIKKLSYATPAFLLYKISLTGLTQT